MAHHDNDHGPVSIYDLQHLHQNNMKKLEGAYKKRIGKQNTHIHVKQTGECRTCCVVNTFRQL